MQFTCLSHHVLQVSVEMQCEVLIRAGPSWRTLGTTRPSKPVPTAERNKAQLSSVAKWTVCLGKHDFYSKGHLKHSKTNLLEQMLEEWEAR